MAAAFLILIGLFFAKLWQRAPTLLAEWPWPGWWLALQLLPLLAHFRGLKSGKKEQESLNEFGREGLALTLPKRPFHLWHLDVVKRSRSTRLKRRLSAVGRCLKTWAPQLSDSLKGCVVSRKLLTAKQKRNRKQPGCRRWT